MQLWGEKRTSQIKSLFPFEFHVSFALSYKGMGLYLFIFHSLLLGLVTVKELWGGGGGDEGAALKDNGEARAVGGRSMP